MKRAEIACITLTAMVLVSVVFVGLNVVNDNIQSLAASPLSRFSSFEQLKNFVESGQQNYQTYMRSGDFALSPSVSPLLTVSSGQKNYEVAPASAGSDYSTTNVQVQGVDEIDFVKTDGEFLYVVSSGDIFIVKAYPAEEAEIISKISLNRTIAGLYIAEDRLVAVEGGGSYYRVEMVGRFEYSQETSIKVFDVSNKAHPILGPNVTISGDYLDSRMIGDYVYTIVTKSVYDYVAGGIVLPEISLGKEISEVPATSIYYSNISDNNYSYTIVEAMNIRDFAHKPTNQTFMFGSANKMYMSLNNLYLAYWDWGNFENSAEKTTVHRIHIEEDAIDYVASGSVPGYVLNQFSMDEYNGYFRIATSGSGWRTFSEGQNNVYVLDMDLKIVGSIEGLAPGEKIYSARFVGKRGYLVTFKKIDPLFVIDLANPEYPTVLGYLKVTGYSDYLQPYDETHMIGIGKETVAAEEGDFAWYQGVKISLFDVSNVEHPVEIAKYEIGDRGTDSPVLSDHKALLFDQARNLLVLPIALHEIDTAENGGEVPPNTYGDLVWQGAYVFNVTVSEGLVLKGRISHLETSVYDSEHYVKRALYIDNVLFTVSDKTIRMNKLDTLELIKQVQLP